MEKYKVLIADDDKLVRIGNGKLLQTKGYQVTLAASGQEAIEHLKKSAFDIVLTNLIMGAVDGISVLKESKKLHPTTAVIMLTGYLDVQSSIDAFKAGVDDYVLKPCNPEDLFNRIAEALSKSRQQFVTICSACKKIRTKKGKWISIESFLDKWLNLLPTSGYCPDCLKKEMNELNK